jgi:Domain of unknown function (DUF4404)
MSSDKVRELLKQLRQELQATDWDPATSSLIQELDRDIHKALKSSETPVDALLDRAKALEVKFSVNHGVAEKILRELVETLAKIGV